ncbi:MAG TPA: hypothetical protein VFP96_13740 [Candidatus Acidoferrum sp.]|nr:hypothetical protein [Candidatus Acidoferrum sp.]
MRSTPLKPLTRFNFFATLAVFALSLFIANRTVAHLTRHTLPRQAMAQIAASPGANILLSGNSLLVAGFDPAEFRSQLHLPDASHDVLNLAMTSTGPVEHLLFLRYALEHGAHPRLVVYGFVDSQISQPTVLANRDLIGKREVLYYLEPGYARRFYSMSFRDSLEFQIMRRVSLLSERSAVWGKVELLRRHLSAQGMPLEQENSFGRIADFNSMEAPDRAGFTALMDGYANAPLNAPAEELLRLSQSAGARVVFVEMPMSSAHRRDFYDSDSWRRYRSHVQSLLAAQNAIYLNASDWIPDDALFQDHIHLNSTGATVFTRKLAQELMQRVPEAFQQAGRSSALR